MEYFIQQVIVPFCIGATTAHFTLYFLNKRNK